MGSSKSKEIVPIEYPDGSVKCIQHNIKTSNAKVNKSKCGHDPPCHQNMQMTYPQHCPNVEGNNMFLLPPQPPHNMGCPPSYLTPTGVPYLSQPQPPPVFVESPQVQQGNLYIDENKINRLFQEFVAISGNGHAMDFNSFRLLFMAALCRVDFKNANEFALNTFSKFDRNRDGYIDFNEFLNGYQILEQAEQSHIARVLPGSAHLFADSLPNAITEKRGYPASPYGNVPIGFVPREPTSHYRSQMPKSYGHQVDSVDAEHF